jgi:hypothetical protein
MEHQSCACCVSSCRICRPHLPPAPSDAQESLRKCLGCVSQIELMGGPPAPPALLMGDAHKSKWCASKRICARRPRGARARRWGLVILREGRDFEGVEIFRGARILGGSRPPTKGGSRITPSESWYVSKPIMSFRLARGRPGKSRAAVGPISGTRSRGRLFPRGDRIPEGSEPPSKSRGPLKISSPLRPVRAPLGGERTKQIFGAHHF